MVALIWTCVYTFVVQRVSTVERAVKTPRGRIVVAALFGAFIWCFMTFVVIPLSQAKPGSPTTWRWWGMLAWHMIGVGPPTVWFTRPVRAAAALAPVP